MIKREWADVLGTVREATMGPALLGGGALRDADNERPVKDLDVFVPARDNSEFSYKVAALICYWGEPTESYLEDKTYRVWNHKVTGVVGWDAAHFPTPIQVIGMDLPEFDATTLVNSFDIGLCQIASGGDYIWKSKAYNADVEDHRLTIMPCQQGGISTQVEILTRTLKRLVRINAKYADWEPRVHEDFFGPPVDTFGGVFI